MSKKKLSARGRSDQGAMVRATVSIQRCDLGAYEVRLLVADYWGKPLLDRFLCVCWTYDEAAREVPQVWKWLESTLPRVV